MILLSRSQREIVETQIGRPIQVLASAGSGKTRVLTERVRFILENTRKDGVIAFTFTNKAADELRARLADLDEAADRCWIATIHGVAQRVVEQYGHTIGLPSDLHIYEREQDRKVVFLQSLREQEIDIDGYLNVKDPKKKKQRERNIQSLFDKFSTVKRELLTEQEARTKYAGTKNFWVLYQAYQEALLQSGGMDFDDILVYAHRILIEQPWCGEIYRAKYRHLCVDEAQDLNRAQYELIRAFCADDITSVMMVGDPDQMIYGFNSSSQEFLCDRFPQDFKPEQYVLKENFRSAQGVVHLANQLKPGSQFMSDYVISGKYEIKQLPDEVAEAEWICTTITDLLKLKTDHEIEGEIDLNSMVVIARNRFVFQTLEEHLNANEIPYYLKKQERLGEPTSIFGNVLDLAIRLRLNPMDWVSGKKLCAVLNVTPPSSWGHDNLLFTMAELARTSDVLLPELHARLLESILGLDIDRPNVLNLCSEFEMLLQSLAQNVEGPSINEIERSLQELIEFRTAWVTFRQRGLGESLQAFRNAIALGQLATEFEATGLSLSTVHTMKGLEKDIVFLMGMCEGVFPDYRASTEQELEEERNIAFVAVTRARRRIYITYPRQRRMPWGAIKVQQPSRFVRDMLE